MSSAPPTPDTLERILGAPVSGLQALAGGASSELWAFEVERRGCYVLRRSPAASLGVSMSVQAAVMSAAGRAGVPVPEVVVAGEDPEIGPFIIMDRVEGEAVPRRILRDEGLDAARKRFATEAGEALGRLCTVPPESVAGLEWADPFLHYRETLDALGAPSPTFEWAFRRLGASRPRPSRPAVVHGDFRLGNLMLAPSGIRAVLDWELVHAGDPLEDLGWLCTTTWRFGQQKPVGGLGDYDELLDAYEEAGGRRVDMDTLRWWEVFGSLKWGVICMMQAARHFAGAPSVELATIGRRVSEVEWDLLELLT